MTKATSERHHANEWQVGDITVRLAGGDLGDRAKQPSALSRTLTRALNVTVTTVIAGQVKPMNNRRTTVSGWECRGRSSSKTFAMKRLLQSREVPVPSMFGPDQGLCTVD